MTTQKYFSKKEPIKTRLVQARLPESLFKDIKAFMKKQGINWTKMIGGALESVRDKIKEDE